MRNLLYNKKSAIFSKKLLKTQLGFLEVPFYQCIYKYPFFFYKRVFVDTLFMYNKIMNNNTFWGRAKPLIKALNMTQKQFADYLGYSYNTLKGWIQFNRVPDLSAAYNVAYALGVTLDYLLSGKDRDIAAKRLWEIEARKAATRVLELSEKIQKEMLLLRPLLNICKAFI